MVQLTGPAKASAIGAPRDVDVSVLVPTKERPELLHACIRSILASDHPSFEVLIIDQSKEPYSGTHDPRVDVRHSQARGKSAALNEALGRAKGRFLAFTDDDCTVSSDWLAKGQSLL